MNVESVKQGGIQFLDVKTGRNRVDGGHDTAEAGKRFAVDGVKLNNLKNGVQRFGMGSVQFIKKEKLRLMDGIWPQVLQFVFMVFDDGKRHAGKIAKWFQGWGAKILYTVAEVFRCGASKGCFCPRR